MCRECVRQSTVTASTIFDKTRTPLRVWLAAAWYLTNQKQGMSALGLQRVLGLGSYQTAWTMLHRFRREMVRPDRGRLKADGAASARGRRIPLNRSLGPVWRKFNSSCTRNRGLMTRGTNGTPFAFTSQSSAAPTHAEWRRVLRHRMRKRYVAGNNAVR